MNIVVFLLAGIAVLLFFAGKIRKPNLRRSNKEHEQKRTGIDDVPLLLDLLASLFDAGLPLERGLSQLAAISGAKTSNGLFAVSSALGLGAGWETAWRSVPAQARDGPLGRVEQSVRFVALTGAPSAGLLRAEGRRLRNDSQREAQRRAAALGVKLVLPMGLCALPAFICWAVIPVLLALLPTA